LFVIGDIRTKRRDEYGFVACENLRMVR